jgi:hypothetical protein
MAAEQKVRLLNALVRIVGRKLQVPPVSKEVPHEEA